MAVVSLTTCAHVHGVDTCVLIYLRTGVNLMRYWAILESESHSSVMKLQKKERCQHFVSDGMK